jgi:hypothetical protein
MYRSADKDDQPTRTEDDAAPRRPAATAAGWKVHKKRRCKLRRSTVPPHRSQVVCTTVSAAMRTCRLCFHPRPSTTRRAFLQVGRVRGTRGVHRVSPATAPTTTPGSVRCLLSASLRELSAFSLCVCPVLCWGPRTAPRKQTDQPVTS